jgi:membrane protease YdiL (CAAX protease family)
MSMTTLPDLLYVALFAIAAPLIDYSVFWPAHRRLSQTDPAWSRTWLCAWTIGNQWTLVAFGAAIWMASGRSLASLGFTAPDGWRLWAAIALLLLVAAYQGCAIRILVHSAEQRARLRRQVSSLTVVLPHTRTELHWFGGASLTAGFCEEFLYRGYFIVAFAPWFGWWGAATLSLPFFAVAHLYQGWNGVLQSGVVGALFTLVVAVSESLWPAIALHALIDFGSGTMAWLALRERPEATFGAAQ